jgi:carboxyl-terminal processing protease
VTTRRALVVATTAAALWLGHGRLAADVPKGLETFDAAWTIVRDTHFDKTFNGVDWEAAREEFRPRAAAATTTAELRSVIRAMLARLGQSHFAILPATADSSTEKTAASGLATPGFDVRLVGRDVLVTRVEPEGGAAMQGVHPGWRLTAIGGTPVDELIAPLWELAAAGAPDTDDRVRGLEAWRMVRARLTGRAGSLVQVTFEDGTGVRVTREIARAEQPGQPITVGNLPTMYVRVTNETRKTPAGRTAGVVGFNIWMATVDRPFQLAIDQHRSASGIVVDLRGNPGGLAGMLMGIAGHFIPEAIPLGVMKMRDSELKFTVNPRRVSAAGERVEIYKGPVAILVDGLSGSASECFTGGMQSLNRVRVFGERTMGAALPSQFDRLPNGDVFIHATGDFVTADGTRLEGRGVLPDERIPVTRESLLSGRDGPLDAALAWIDSEQSKGSR